MPSGPDRTNSIRLPAVLAIGFTGHRSLKDEHKLRQQIRDFLREQKGAFEGIVYGVSSAAAGGDQLFAESCLELEIPLRVLLPRPAERFREDFDEAAWQRTERILKDAVSVEVIGAKSEQEGTVLRLRDSNGCGEPAFGGAVGRTALARRRWNAGDRFLRREDWPSRGLDS